MCKFDFIWLCIPLVEDIGGGGSGGDETLEVFNRIAQRLAIQHLHTQPLKHLRTFISDCALC